MAKSAPKHLRARGRLGAARGPNLTHWNKDLGVNEVLTLVCVTETLDLCILCFGTWFGRSKGYHRKLETPKPL